MPIHDWTRVDAGLFHHFHQLWTAAISNSLNAGNLPPHYFALLEQQINRDETDIYAAKADRITIRHRHGDVVSVVEIVSPGNKGSRAEFRAFVQKSADLIRLGVHLLIIDLFPPGPRDPSGVHKAIWSEFRDEEFTLPAGKPLTLASYDAGSTRVAYVEFVAVGEALPELPLFLKPEMHVQTPLEKTYESAWSGFPTALKGLLELSS